MILNLSHALPGPRLTFFLGCVTIPRWCLGVFCWQRLVPPIPRVERLAYPRLPLLKRVPIPMAHQGTEKPLGLPGTKRRARESLGDPGRYRLGDKRTQPPQEGATLRVWQVGSHFRAPRGSVAEGDGQERDRGLLLLVSSQRQGEGSAQALTFSCLPIFPNMSSKLHQSLDSIIHPSCLSQPTLVSMSSHYSAHPLSPPAIIY